MSEVTRPRKPFNPAMQGMMLVPIGNPQGTFDDGYRRFAECAKCNKTFKIFICFKGSEKSCNGSENTHTHLNCDCGPENAVKFAGAVQLKTKKDKVSNERTVTVSKDEFEKLKAIAASKAKEEE